MRWLGTIALLFLGSAGVLPAALNIATSSLPQATITVPYSVQLQATGAAGTVSWTLFVNQDAPTNLPPGLTLNSNGVINGTPTTTGNFFFQVKVQDQTGAVAGPKGLTIDVGACVPTITPDGTTPLPGGDIGVLYPPLMFTGTGCQGPFMFAGVTSPFNPASLPPGFTFSGAILSGKPTALGTFNFVITITGPNSYENEIQYTLTVNPLPTVTTASPLPTGPVGAPYSQQIAATGGTPPYTFSMNNNPPGINITPDGVLNGTPTKPGTFSFNIGVTDSLRGQTTAPFEVTFASAVTQVQAAPLSLTFNADLQGNPPPSQAISVVPANGATPPVNFTVSIDSGQSNSVAPSWISVSPTTASAPAGLVVTVDQGTLPAGAYPARVRLVDNSGIATNVAVTLIVTSATPQLNVAPGILPFTARAASADNLVEDLLVSNSGTGSINFTTSVLGNSSWITGVTPSSGATTRNAPVYLQVQVNTNGLQVGAYRGAIQVASSGQTITVPVSLFVGPSSPILGLGTTGALFQAVQGGGSTSIRQIEVLNAGDPNSTVNWSASLMTGSSWLNLVSSNGVATSAAPGTLTLALAPNATQLTPGPYYAIVKITDANSLDSPQYVTAVLNLQPSSTAPSPDVAPGGLFFTTSVGGPAPPAPSFQVNTSSASAVTFQATATTADNTAWLNVTPASGTVSGQTAATLSVSVNATGLAAGIYSGDVNVSIGQSLESVNVTLVVQGNGAASSISRLRPKTAGCTASQLAITETGLPNNFAVPAGWPATLIVQVNDDCGAPVTNGNVVASFSNGDAALSLMGDSVGNYSATWQPSGVNADMVVTLNASAGILQPASAKLYGGIAQNQTPPPTLAPNGTLNNLNPLVGAPLAPGTIAQVFGTGLASTPISTSGLPLPDTFDQTFALVGPSRAPLYYLSSGQVNIQIPNEIKATQQIPILLSVNNALTVPTMISIVPVTPGVASYNGGSLIAQHSDFTLVTSISPAKPGEALMMYLVGLGATNPSVASGAPAPSSPLAAVTVEPTVTVDGQPAKIAFAGLTPGFVGLYQINFQVPTNASSGDLVVAVTQNSVAANQTTLPVSN